jgi:hypothetical protein
MKTLGLLLVSLSFSAAGADEEFTRWWPQFQAAAAKGDATAVSERSKFPMDWENGPVRKIETRQDFIARFNTYFTADMKHAVASRKPVAIPGGYMITWKARGNEYSLHFRPAPRAYALSGLSEGPD